MEKCVSHRILLYVHWNALKHFQTLVYCGVSFISFHVPVKDVNNLKMTLFFWYKKSFNCTWVTANMYQYMVSSILSSSTRFEEVWQLFGTMNFLMYRELMFGKQEKGVRVLQSRTGKGSPARGHASLSPSPGKKQTIFFFPFLTDVCWGLRCED